ncbi:DUF3883 domain-containing protein [Luteimonas sp. WGS1318]|uniref:DUF3883 domain-containing protein n=1 Tax=Luteimonas sp. WGS1318 TaxID=3366815 RepID=UPI00372CFA1F
METVDGETGAPWTDAEIEATVATYFQMLRTQELGQALNKAEHNRRLQARIPARSRGAIEFKHANISAVLMEVYDAPPLRGYLPRFNYQSDLVIPVGHALAADRVLDEAALRNVQSVVETPLLDSYDAFVVDAPSRTGRRVREPRKDWSSVVPVKRDYLQREALNRSLGLAGEHLVMEYEARRLHALGARILAKRIEHVSQTRGDGVGHDVLSFEADGRERFIEVKTTAYLAETPFFISPSEAAFSDSHAEQFHLYRVFDFRQSPRMFMLPGAVGTHCRLDPVSFRATLLAR